MLAYQRIYHDKWLVGGMEHEFYFSIYGEELSQLRGRYTTNQMVMVND
jgi:hypothetical protein